MALRTATPLKTELLLNNCNAVFAEAEFYLKKNYSNAVIIEYSDSIELRAETARAFRDFFRVCFIMRRSDSGEANTPSRDNQRKTSKFGTARYDFSH